MLKTNFNNNILYVLICFITSSLNAQITGTVLNSKKEPLPFVNIYIEDTFIGTTTNEEGYYELNVDQKTHYSLIFKFLGYKTKQINVNVDQYPFTVNVVLEEELLSLDEVVLNANENPANRIIRAAIENRTLMLEKINSYNADFYSRGLIRIKDAPEKMFGQNLDDFLVGLDSTRSGIIYLSETVSKINYLYPDKLSEKVKASKISGDDNGFSFNTASDVDYNFYKNTIELGNQIVSPIADYAFNYYRYELEGIFYDDLGNLINKIKVIPKRENDRIFSGTIYIVEDQWSIYALELDITGQQAQIPPADIITLNQSYSFSQKDNIWVLISQSIDFSYSLFGIKGNGRFNAVYSNYNFNTNFTKNTFSKEILSFENQANKKDSSFWNENRPIPLTQEESNDYEVKDSIQTVRESKTYLDSIDNIRNRFKIMNVLTGYSYQNSYKDRYFNISSPLNELNFNTVQGYNSTISINYRKNYDEFRNYFSFNTAFNYGFEDDRLRGTLSATYKFNDVKRPFLSLSGGIITQQFNSSQPITPFINSISTLFFEDNYMKLYEKRFAQFNFSQEIFNGLNFYSSLSYENRKPLFNNSDYAIINEDNDSYTSNNPLNEDAFGIPSFDSHNLFKLNITARLRFGQRYYSYPNSKFSVANSKYPTVYMSYQKGFGASRSNYDFDQIQIRLNQGLNIGNKGEFQYNLKIGKFLNADSISFVDYKHFNGNQTRIGTSSNYLNVFNNLPYYALSTNKSYLEFHTEHDFKGLILGKLPLINKLNYNLILGAHILSTTNNSPYKEFSIGIDNIGFKKFRFLRLDYIRSYQNGFTEDAVIFGLKFLNFIN